MEIRSIDKLEREAQLRDLVREYLNHEISELRAVSGLDLNVDELVANTFDHIDEYLPPAGGLHISIDGSDNLQGCVFLKMIRPDACEIKRLYVKPAARGLGLGRKLMESILSHASNLGAARVLLDTGVYDTAAQGLYHNLGFRQIESYPEGESDPELQPYLLFMQLDL
ncbi:GNAT family N-acetyltransferase [Sulfitobacter sp. JL08]|uniref:GNAT family N-acetyltransferase n=1 Tax=Sulfitobacter sp. JL08 TaxID=2070369 RepID=UPI000E0A3C2A|nr:GNAT family N-acetyltransferase [Sulfitobacter sp. JL08]AXI53828.1 GNAT family N-acetyltransferase [Sulfitobacter sp. JL08]